jgi:hypothetical protein
MVCRRLTKFHAARAVCRIATVLAGVLPALGLAQKPCTNGIRIDGTVTDQTGAIVAGALVQSADGRQSTTDTAGHFLLLCVPSTSAIITVQADGFAQAAVRARAPLGGAAYINVSLAIDSVRTVVDVSSDTPGMDTDNGASTTVLNTADVERLPDDPDDLLRQLQMLAAASGGNPSAATVTVDGFQNRSALPPKSSIASIRVNPDLFSSQYEWPPWGGGVIEITTKPGPPAFHGALFFTDSNGIFNATNPFSTTATPASKERYGFELSGPIIRQKSDFFLALEKRDIDEFNVVNATTLDTNGAPAPFSRRFLRHSAFGTLLHEATGKLQRKTSRRFLFPRM